VKVAVKSVEEVPTVLEILKDRVLFGEAAGDPTVGSDAPHCEV
jgi:hypothetical protein